MKTIAINGLNQLVDNGAKRTREGWMNWASRRANFTAGEIAAGFQIVVSLFENERGSYFRIHAAGQRE